MKMYEITAEAEGSEEVTNITYTFVVKANTLDEALDKGKKHIAETDFMMCSIQEVILED